MITLLFGKLKFSLCRRLKVLKEICMYKKTKMGAGQIGGIATLCNYLN